MRAAMLTDTGLVRGHNEDAYCVRTEALGALPNLLLVADGMGGHRGGEYASRFVVSRMQSLLEASEQTEDIRRLLEDSLDRVNRELFEKSGSTPELRGMGSTAVLAVLAGSQLHVLNVGDSRLYHFDGSLHQVTSDHSWVEEMVARGALQRTDPLYEARKNVLTRAVGVDAVLESDYYRLEVSPGDRILLCSDGLHGYVSSEAIEETLAQAEHPAAAVHRLIALANQSGGKDNITAIVCSVE